MKRIGLLLAALALPLAIHAATINVSTSSQLASAAASANPGDTIVLANGNYSGFTMHRSGNSSAAITFQAANVGGAVINSGTIVLTNLSYVNLDGIKFTTSGGSTTVDGTSRAFAVLIVNANYCRVTRCTFALSGEASGTGWVTLDANSQHNQVDHCAFGPNSVGGHSHYIYPAGSHSIPGVTPPSCRDSWANGGSPYNTDMPRFTEIDHNYFHDMGSGDGETIVLGGAGVCGDYQGTMTTVENNLFVNCNGDPEVVSIKSSTNTVRFNTFVTCGGVVSFRSGNNSWVYGNFFLCGGVSGSGGVKINEMHHKVYNNYIENAGSYPIMLEDGDFYCTNTFAHAQVVDAEIEYNTVINPALEVLVGHSSTTPLRPTGCVFANNILSGSSTLYKETSGSSVTRSQNISYSYNPGLSGFIIQDPLLTSVTENSYTLQKLSSGSPAIGAANASYYSYVTTDMDGQTRSSPDIGADEYSTGSVSITPLTTSNVGPASGGGITNAADFTISASPSSQTVTAGSGTTYTASIGALNGFSGSVSLSVSGLPVNASASFSPTSVSGSGSSTLTVNTTSSTPTGTSTLTITGTSGSLTHSTTVSLTVSAAPDFSLSASPSSVTVTQGSSGNSTISVADLNGFSGSVSLSASGLPSGVTASFNPSSTTSSSTLTLTASSTATTGTASVTITGTSGSLTHTATVSLTVNASSGGPLPSGWTDADIGPVGMAGSASYNSGTFTVSGSGADIYNAADEFNYAYESVSGDQTVIARVVSENGDQSYSKAGVMIRESTASNSVFAAVLITPTNGVAMEVRSTAGASAVNVAGWIRNILPPQWVKVVRSGSTFTGYYSADGSTWTQIASTNVTMNTSATAGLAVTDHSNSGLNTAAFDNVSTTGPAPDFSLSALPNSVTVTQGNNTTSTITVNPVNGYNNSVSLSASGLPSGVTASFNPSSTTTSSTLTLTASSTAATGTATVTITGTDGTLTHSTTISLTVNAAVTFSGLYEIQNQASGLVLNNQGRTTNGSPITQWKVTTSSNLDWTFIATSNGYYQINSAKSGLDAVVQGASTANGAGIVQWSFGSSGDDQWLPQQNSDGSYTFFNLHSGLVLEDPGSSTNTSTQMDQWSSNGGSNQKWNLLKQ